MDRYAPRNVMNTDRIPNPCIDCSRRSIGCHGVCAEYGDYKKAIEDMRAAIKADKAVDEVVDAYVSQRSRRIKRALQNERGKS